jgi:hypothetical protein
MRAMGRRLPLCYMRKATRREDEWLAFSVLQKLYHTRSHTYTFFANDIILYATARRGSLERKEEGAVNLSSIFFDPCGSGCL